LDKVYLWDYLTGKEQLALVHSQGVNRVNAVAFSPDGATLASGGDGGVVKLWDLDAGKEKATLQGHTGHITSIAFSADGKTLVTSSLDSK
jgi:WD40 repeat protein